MGSSFRLACMSCHWCQQKHCYIDSVTVFSEGQAPRVSCTESGLPLTGGTGRRMLETSTNEQVVAGISQGREVRKGAHEVQALQASHWPAQRGCVSPHSVHLYTFLVLPELPALQHTVSKRSTSAPAKSMLQVSRLEAD